MYGLIVYNSTNHTVYDRKNNVMRDFCDNRNCSKMYKFGGNYTFYWHPFTFIIDTFVCLAYFTLLEQKRKQPLGGIGIESNLR